MAIFMMLRTKPFNFERLGIVVMMSVSVGLPATLARLRDYPTSGDRALDGFVSCPLFRIVFIPSSFAYLYGRIIAYPFILTSYAVRFCPRLTAEATVFPYSTRTAAFRAIRWHRSL
jgi:hypothetical protein